MFVKIVFWKSHEKRCFFCLWERSTQDPTPTLCSGPHQTQNFLELNPVPLVYLLSPNYHQGIKILTSESFSVFHKLWSYTKKETNNFFFFWAHRSRQSSGVFNDAHLGFKKENQEGEAKESMAEITSFPRGGGWGSVWVWGCQNVLKVTWKKTVFFRLLKPAYQHLPGWLRADSNNQDSKYVCVCDGGRSAAEAILPSWFND